MTDQRNLRLIVLLTILGLLLFAVWYDYKVARPSVDQAFDRVGFLNRKINSSAKDSSMTNKEVQEAVGFDPTYTITKGNYQVEVYAWTAGLPFRSHDYYAVYVGQGSNLTFMRHYKFSLPDEELKPKDAVPQLASARRAARNPGPDPNETIGHAPTDPGPDPRDTVGVEQATDPGQVPREAIGVQQDTDPEAP